MPTRRGSVEDRNDPAGAYDDTSNEPGYGRAMAGFRLAALPAGGHTRSYEMAREAEPLGRFALPRWGRVSAPGSFGCRGFSLLWHLRGNPSPSGLQVIV